MASQRHRCGPLLGWHLVDGILAGQQLLVVAAMDERVASVQRRLSGARPAAVRTRHILGLEKRPDLIDIRAAGAAVATATAAA